MKNLMKHLLYKGTGIGQRNVAWNIAGNFIYALASMVLSSLIIRVVGGDQGSISPFESSTLEQQTFIVAYFGIRPLQITDGTGEYSFGDYLEHESITCVMVLGAGVVSLTFTYGMGHYTADKRMILILLVIHRVMDEYAGVYESEFQRQGSLCPTGKSNFPRTPFSAGVLPVTLAVLEHLLFSCLAAVAAQTAGIVLLNLDVVHVLPSMGWDEGKRRMGKLFKSTSFLFIPAFLDFYTFSATKYVTDTRLNNATSGYFNLTFTSISVIYMVADFVIRPFLTKFIDLWTGEDYDCFRKELRRTGTVILGLTMLIVGVIAVLGKWMLSVMEMTLGSSYEGRLVSYYETFIIIVLGGGFYALVNLIYYAPVIIRRQKTIFIVYLAAAVTAAVLPGFLVSESGIDGVVGCYLLSIMGLVTGFGLHMAGAC